MTAKAEARRPRMPKDLCEAIRFHGHFCGGLMVGYLMTKAAMKALGVRRAEDEELVAVVENKACGADAVQWLTGCTFGKGNFFFLDHGKHVLTLARRGDRKAVRVRWRPQLDEGEVDDWLDYLRVPHERLCDVRHIRWKLPPKARIESSLECDKCGELVMASRTVSRRGKTLCLPCAGRGFAIEQK